MDFQRQKTGVAVLSVVSNTTLVLMKIVIGLIIGSVAVLSEAIHSGIDLVAAIIALVAVRTSSKPADADHPYGHGKIENISGAIEALLIFLAAAWIIVEAVKKLQHHEPVTHAGFGVLVMALSAALNWYVSHRLFKIGKATDSIALQADGWHLRTDVYTSIGVMVGLGALWLGSLFFSEKALYWVDPAAAIAVALLIIKAAWDLTLQSTRDLLDASLPVDEEQWIREYLDRLRPTICGYHHLRTRKAGANRFIEFHLLVERGMTVEDSHRISDVLTCDIEDRYPGSLVTIHIEPCDGACGPVCVSGCLLPEEERERIRQEAQTA